ncbi:hypothetical protein OXIME_000600 [Oxyplasma meridianum]|uniref:DUF304 domain-containing protein n=1 Tax=Oxyplasma meridianum TaxID=3073602 RepID=A0AAX4NGS2_9ARCH
MNKPGIKKTTIKSLIALAIFSLVLEISSKTIIKYLLFVALWLFATFLYELYKYSTKYSITVEGVSIRSLIKSKFIYNSNVKETFIVEGYLQKKFGLSSVYLVTNNGVIAIRDISYGRNFLEKVNKGIGKEPMDST